MKKIELSELTKFKKASANSLESHGVAQAFEDVGLDRNGENLFGSAPEVYYAKKDLEVGDVALQGEGGVYILDGSLSVKGTLRFLAFDSYTVLVITGDLKVTKDLVQLVDTQLIVMGNVVVGETMWLDFSDAGFTVMRKEVKTKSWKLVNDSVDNAFLVSAPPIGHEITSEEFETVYEKYKV